jgi:tetratricopeptide (TPR) repeat protein
MNYASVANELGIHKIALFFFDKLSKIEPDNVTYLGYLGNSCLNLNFNDLALSAYKKASDIANDSQEWILSNIGNLLKNRGFYSEGIKYLRKALELNDSSEYALDRLSTSLKFKEDESKEFDKQVKEGYMLIKEFSAQLALDTTKLTS